MDSLATCGHVSDIGFTWPVVELVNLDILPPPGLHMISTTLFSNQTSKILWSHSTAEMVHWESPKSEILLGSLLNPGKIDVMSLASSNSPLSSVLGVETVGDVGVTLAFAMSSRTEWVC